MNLPNKLTILRVILIIPFVLCMLLPGVGTAGKYVAVAIFIFASLTDMLDGKIARKNNLVTNFGKFMDPLADKLLVSSNVAAYLFSLLLSVIRLLASAGVSTTVPVKHLWIACREIL